MNSPNDFTRRGLEAQKAVDQALEKFSSKHAAAPAAPGVDVFHLETPATAGRGAWQESPGELAGQEITKLLKWYSVGRLYACDNGRIGLNGHEFHCGECFEIFKPILDSPDWNSPKSGRWMQVRIEHSSCFYLVGDARQGQELIGIVARIKT